MVVKWAVPEEYSQEARRLLESEHDLVAPDILRVETANALLKKVRRRELAREDARAAIEALSGYLQLSPTEVVFEHGVDVSLEFGCTFFDGLYVAFALLEGCPLVTGDLRLIRMLPGSFAGEVVWVGDLTAGV